MLKIVQDAAALQQFGSSLDEIARRGAERMLMMALEAEVDDYVTRFRSERDAKGHALVTRNAYARSRKVVCGVGAFEVRAPRANDRRIDSATGERLQFKSVILRAVVPPLPEGLRSAAVAAFARLVAERFRAGDGRILRYEGGLVGVGDHKVDAELGCGTRRISTRDLSDRDYVYIWADGIHFSIRLGEDDRLCCLVIVGVRVDGTKELIAIADGYRESTESWAELLRDCKSRGMSAPVLAAGDGALGFWGAVTDVFPGTRHQRDWVHKIANVLDALPKSLHAAAKRAAGDLGRARQADRRPSSRSVRCRLRQVPQGRRQDQQGSRATARLLRLSGGALAAPTNVESDRVDVLVRACTKRRHQRTRIRHRRHGDDLQAPRGRGRTLARSQRAASRRARTSGRKVR